MPTSEREENGIEWKITRGSVMCSGFDSGLRHGLLSHPCELLPGPRGLLSPSSSLTLPPAAEPPSRGAGEEPRGARGPERSAERRELQRVSTAGSQGGKPPFQAANRSANGHEAG